MFDAEVRERTRASLGIERKLVFVWPGSIDGRNLEDVMIPFVRQVVSASARAHLLVLTQDVVRAHTVLTSGGLAPEAFTVRRARQHEVAGYLCAADAGLLLPADTLRMRLACPVKLAEYLSCGVPVLASRTGGWVEKLIDENDAGLVVDCVGRPDHALRAEAARVCAELERRGDELRQAALALCEREFLWSRYTGIVRDAYRTALEWARVP
jgi:glycosyltransferase involved in cell wall biosynthesis